MRGRFMLASLAFLFSPAALASAQETELRAPAPKFGSEEAVSRTYHLCRFVNSLGMELSRVPAGTFIMGSPEEEPGRKEDEAQHRVTIPNPFYMQVTEVTRGQWKKLMGNDPSHFAECGDECPVEQVTWNEAVEFCNRLSALEGFRPAYGIGEQGTVWDRGADGYRLPTEAEWEFACRAGSTSAFCTGTITRIREAMDPNLDRVGWYFGNALGTRPVRQKECNSWGLYDMHGNVWEWCWDWYGQYDTRPATDPAGPPDGSRRVLRGGSWYGDAKNCRSADRIFYSPGGKNYSLGFRLCRTIPK
ncbi:MAG: formylglycine-generating enzyme family protein [bacterium]